MMLSRVYDIVGTFEGENFHEFRGFVAIHEAFAAKFGCMVSFGTVKASNLRKFSPQKLYFSPICKKFSPSNVSCHTV